MRGVGWGIPPENTTPAKDRDSDSWVSKPVPLRDISGIFRGICVLPGFAHPAGDKGVKWRPRGVSGPEY